MIIMGGALKLIISVDSVRFPLTGIGRYNYELARRLVVREDLCVRLFSGCRFLPSFPHVAQVPNEKYRLKRTLDNAFFMRLYGALMPVLRGRALRGNEDSIFHGANFLYRRLVVVVLLLFTIFHLLQSRNITRPIESAIGKRK